MPQGFTLLPQNLNAARGGGVVQLAVRYGDMEAVTDVLFAPQAHVDAIAARGYVVLPNQINVGGTPPVFLAYLRGSDAAVTDIVPVASALTENVTIADAASGFSGAMHLLRGDIYLACV